MYRKCNPNAKAISVGRKVDRLAQFYGIPMTDLLDDYSRFLQSDSPSRLHQHRTDRGMTRADFAQLLGITWAVRAGMDHQKVMRYILESRGDLEDPEVWNEYAHLMLLCQYPDLQYKYECRRRGQNVIYTQSSQNAEADGTKNDK